MYAEIVDSTEYGSIQVDSEIYEITSGEQTLIKAWGTINDIHGGAKLILVVILPDGLTDGLYTIPTSDGYFETFWVLDEESQLGQYRITASYARVPLGEVTFEIKEKKFSEQELLTARQLLDQHKNNTETTINEDVVEIPKPLSEEIKDDDLFDQGLEKFNQQKYDVALILFNRALDDDPYNIEIKNMIQKTEKISLENKCENVSFQSFSDYDVYSECCDLKPVRERHACKQELVNQKNQFLKEQYSSVITNPVKQENKPVVQKDNQNTIDDKEIVSKSNTDTIVDKKITSKNDSFSLYLILGGVVLIVIILYLKIKKRSIPSFVITTSHLPKQQLDNEIKWEGI